MTFSFSLGSFEENTTVVESTNKWHRNGDCINNKH